jgi:hypothetical protein
MLLLNWLEIINKPLKVQMERGYKKQVDSLSTDKKLRFKHKLILTEKRGVDNVSSYSF